MKHENWRTPTRYIGRFSDAMAALCGGNRPLDDILINWVQENDDVLQDFACRHGPSWSQGIVLIEAAQMMADQPTEGVKHETLAEFLIENAKTANQMVDIVI